MVKLRIIDFKPNNCKISLIIIFDNSILGEVVINYGKNMVINDSINFLKDLASSTNIYNFKIKIMEHLNRLSEKGQLKVDFEGFVQTQFNQRDNVVVTVCES